jgi:transcriptional regulator with XRE-family HTH domain
MSTKSQFGAFFRARRKALGLTLREFCRRNGFDPGNVSRLERGLAAPPQVPEVIESYAKALKIEQGTEEWSHFIELAGAETGRIPLSDQERIRERPVLLRKLRRETRGGGWVSALHLETWADSMEARSMLPQLVRKLVQTTGKEVLWKEFPKGEQVHRSGWDGISETAANDTYVPQGTSGWELGVDKNPLAKAEDDFDKRSKDPQGLNPNETTIIFVTPRKCVKKAEWCQAKKKLGIWKDVRVYDSATLEEWLESSLAVDAWLARCLGLKPEGVTDIDEYWANLQALTTPSFSEKVFLTSQEEAAKEIEQRLEGEAAVIEVNGRSPMDALDFFVACCRLSKAKEALSPKVLIVDEKEAWRGLANAGSGPLILVIHPTFAIESELVAEAVRHGHKVVLTNTEVSAKRSGCVKMRRANPYELEKALVECGLKETEAEQVARKSGGSLTVLKRLRASIPGTDQPAWSLPENATALVPVLLAGGWDETSEADRIALATMAGRPYSELAETVNQWLNTRDSPLKRIGTRWSLISRDDSWFLLGRHVTGQHLGEFEKVAIDVLGEIDPAYTLVAEERWQSSIRGKILQHSSALRIGLTETLALLAINSENLAQPLPASGLADRVIKKLLENQEWERWASLSGQLPVLAEASPDGFLGAAEKDQKRSRHALIEVFEQEGDAMFTSSPHTGLLWALEGLAWDRALLSRVTLILGWLHENDPHGQLANRPMNCLQEIFVPWLPKTTATTEERVRVLRMLMEKRPKAGWPLLISLLPNQIQASTPNHRPMWRDWTLRWKKGVTNVEYWQQANACAELLVENMGTDLGRWRQLIEHYENLPEPTAKKFVKRLMEFDVNSLDGDSRRSITDMIRTKVSDHRRFSDTGWALPAEALRELETIQGRFEPEDVVVRNTWLFGNDWTVEEKLKQDGASMAEVRCNALKEILSKEGWDGVVRIGEAAEWPGAVGYTIADVVGTEYDARILPGLILSEKEKLGQFARSYIWNRFDKRGWEWLKQQGTETWSDTQLGRLLADLPFERSPWEFIEQRPGVEKYYWENALPYLRNEEPDERLAFIVPMLLKYGRPWRLLNVFSGRLHQKKDIPVCMAMDVLEAGLTAEIDSHGSVHGGLKYNVHLLFQYLQKKLKEERTDAQVQRLATLEWRYLGMLDGYPASPETLHFILGDNPEAFVQLLGLVFRPKSESRSEAKEFSEEEKARAQNAYRLLASWKDLPGSKEDGSIEEDKLLGWVREVRRLAEVRGLLEICDSRIGDVLANDPERPAEPWPSDAVKDTLEEIGTDDVFDGFRVGLFNKRGMYRKSLDEGGAQERALEKKYRDFADACTIEWPKTAATLRLLADGYEERAKREDLMVESRW